MQLLLANSDCAMNITFCWTVPMHPSEAVQTTCQPEHNSETAGICNEQYSSSPIQQCVTLSQLGMLNGNRKNGSRI